MHAPCRCAHQVSAAGTTTLLPQGHCPSNDNGIIQAHHSGRGWCSNVSGLCMAAPAPQRTCWRLACRDRPYGHITWVGHVNKQAALLCVGHLSAAHAPGTPPPRCPPFPSYPRSAALWAESCLAMSICRAQEHPQASVTGSPVSASVCMAEEGTVAYSSHSADHIAMTGPLPWPALHNLDRA